MRTKKTFLFDEEKVAKDIYENGFPDGIINYGKMYIVSKYIRQTFGYGKIRLERELILFCKEQDKYFNHIKEAGIIKKWVNSSMKYNLRKIASISISKKEIEFLKAIPKGKDRKILFTMLVFSKALKKGNTKRDKSNIRESIHHYIHYNNFSDIIQLSKINNMSETDLATLLHNYSKHFIFYNPDRELIRLNYTDKDPKEEFIIRDLDNLMGFYNILFEEHRPLGKCEKCYKVIRKNSNRQKYCKECAIIIERQAGIDRKNKWREREKLVLDKNQKI
jgi:hypothetical protein